MAPCLFTLPRCTFARTFASHALTPARIAPRAQTEVRLLLIGLDKAGKTTALERIKALHAAADAPAPLSSPVLPTVGAR